jgi:hypothetical protein
MSLNESHIVGVVTVLYAWVGISYAAKGEFPWALTWLAYALANVGLIWAAKE